MLTIPKLSLITSVTRASFVTLSNSFKVVYVSHATSVIELFAFSGAVVVVISTDLGFTRSSFLREKACTSGRNRDFLDHLHLFSHSCFVRKLFPFLWKPPWRTSCTDRWPYQSNIR